MKRALVVCPLSTVNNWKKEFKIAFKEVNSEKFSILTIADRKEISQKYEIVKKWYLRKKSLLILGYEGFETITNECKLEKAGTYLKARILEALINPGPDLVICDEGHLLRNKKALKTMALNRIRTKRRIVLTGTPLQNNLMEYYHMVHFVKPNLLGNMQEFKTNFVNPITNGQYEDSTKEDIRLMLKRTHVLHKLLKKTIQRVEDSELKLYLPKMVDHAIFIQLHQVQVDLYSKFSNLTGKNSADNNRKGFLSDFAIFQYICTHPYLLAVMEEMKNKRIKERDLITDEQDNPICNVEGWWKPIMPEDAKNKIEFGNKLVVVKSILEECEEIEDKVLIFSQSLGELDLIEHFLQTGGTKKCPSWQKKIDYFRMDGTVLPENRTKICDIFNEKDNKRLRLLLMSTKVGGLGLNLTAANRVIIMTVNWNPSFDTQSVFRVYRFGQEKEVFVYRLISLDSMEEKVYQRTVTKLAIAHRVVDKHQITRHYKSMDLQELYSCKPSADEERPIPNVPEDKVLAKLILRLPFIFKYHEHQALLANRPEDNLNEQELNAAWDEFKRIKDAPKTVAPEQVLPTVSNPNGPTFAMGFALSHYNLPSTNAAQNKAKKGIRLNNGHYYNNMPNKNDFPVKNSLPNNLNVNSNSLNQMPNIPRDTSITLENDNLRLNPFSVDNTDDEKSNREKDPLYIPLEKYKKVKAYEKILASLTETDLRLPPSTSIIVDDESPEKSNQKENSHQRKLTAMPKLTNAAIDHNEHSGDKVPSRGLAANNSINKSRKPNIPVRVSNKRKRGESSDQNQIMKKMRDKFNDFKNQHTTINLDDDDAIVTDTASESGSLSNEVIKNLGLSGISIHKIVKDANNDVITVD